MAEAIRVAISGARGRVGREVVRAVDAAPDLSLVGGLSRAPDATAELSEGRMLRLHTDVAALLAETRPDVLVDFTLPDAALPIARAAINRGDVHLQRRDLPAARADFERAVDVASRHRLEVQRSMAMHNLGYVDLLSGDLPAALRRMSEVAPAFESMSPA